VYFPSFIESCSAHFFREVKDTMSFWNWGNFFHYLFNVYLMGGAWTTVWLTAASVGIGLVLGLIAAIMLMSNSPILRAISKFYVWAWRGTPLLVQLIVIYTGLPIIGLKFTVVQSALLGLGVNEGAYLAEIVRAGILSVSKGQFDAARGLAMDYPTMMRIIILPQAARVIIPSLGNRINGMLKMSSLASVISMEELIRRAQELVQERFAVLEIYMVATIYYLILTTIWNQFQNRIEKYYGRAYVETVRDTSTVSG
jgi:polar amino acid transport system permease protein